MRKSDVESFQSKYLSSVDVADRPRRGRIADVQLERIKGDNVEDKRLKAMLVFREEDLKPMILNATNWDACEEAYGEDADDWIGKTVEMYFDPTIVYMGERKGGVRIRIPGGTGGSLLSGATLTWQEALNLAASAGVDKAALVAALKKAGRNAYNAAKDTALVHRIIAEAGRDEAGFDDGAEIPPPEDDIPF